MMLALQNEDDRTTKSFQRRQGSWHWMPKVLDRWCNDLLWRKRERYSRWIAGRGDVVLVISNPSPFSGTHLYTKVCHCSNMETDNAFWELKITHEYLSNFRRNICKSWRLNTHFIPNYYCEKLAWPSNKTDWKQQNSCLAPKGFMSHRPGSGAVRVLTSPIPSRHPPMANIPANLGQFSLWPPSKT